MKKLTKKLAIKCYENAIKRLNREIKSDVTLGYFRSLEQHIKDLKHCEDELAKLTKKS